MKTHLVVAILTLACMASLAPAEQGNWLQLAQADKPAVDAAKPPPEAATVKEVKERTVESKKKCPLSFAVDYTLISDYVFRGVNISEYSREGRERPNHQMNFNVEYDLEQYGAVGGNLWVELFGADIGGDGDFKQVNYDVYYRYKFSDIGLSLTGGWIARTFPVFKGDEHSTSEVYLIAAYDDSKIFGTKKPVLNPYAAYYHDVDRAENGSWWEFGISHVFEMDEDFGLGGCPVLKDISVIPSLVYGVQHRYYGKLNDQTETTSAVNLLMGLEIAYDLNAAFNIPREYGKLTVSGLLYYSQAFDSAIAHDEFFGGMKIGYKW